MHAADIPAHVPPELVRDFDYADMHGETDVYAKYKKLHEGPDIFYTPHYGGHWVVTRYADMDYVLSNARAFSNRHSTIPPQPIQIPLAESDAPMHGDFRKLLQPFFTLPAVARLEQQIRELTIALIEDIQAQGACDFTAEFALKMPIHITMSLLGLPHEDTPRMLKVAEGVLHSVTLEERMAAYGMVFQYLAEIIPLRRADPGEDMISAIVHGKIDGGRALTDAEILGLCIGLIAGGLDTVPNMLCFMIMFLAKNPGHRQQLVEDPSLVNEAVEELIRRHHIGNFTRVVIQDMEFKGVQLKAGEMIMTPTTLAGLDEQRFPDAMTVDFGREDKKHIAFGRGPHQCIGIFLARAELRIFLTEWMQRIPRFEIKPGAQPVVVAAAVNHFLNLPVVLRAA